MNKLILNKHDHVSKIGKMKVFYLWNELYATGLFVCINANDKDLRRLSHSYFKGSKWKPKMGSAAGRTWWHDDSQQSIIAFRPEPMSMDTFAHELFHYVTFICKSRQIVCDYDNDEPLAYLLGWAAERVAPFVFPHGVGRPAGPRRARLKAKRLKTKTKTAQT